MVEGLVCLQEGVQEECRQEPLSPAKLTSTAGTVPTMQARPGRGRRTLRAESTAARGANLTRWVRHQANRESGSVHCCTQF